MSLTLDTAIAIARTAFEEGKTRGVVNMSVVITDAGGHIRLAMRADGQGNFGIDTAVGKARTALGFNRSSLQLSKTFTDPCAVAAITAATGGAFVPLGGGVLVVEGERILGAAAVSGGLPAVDEEIIIAAVEAAGLSVPR